MLGKFTEVVFFFVNIIVIRTPPQSLSAMKMI